MFSGRVGLFPCCPRRRALLHDAPSGRGNRSRKGRQRQIERRASPPLGSELGRTPVVQVQRTTFISIGWSLGSREILVMLLTWGSLAVSAELKTEDR